MPLPLGHDRRSVCTTRSAHLRTLNWSQVAAPSSPTTGTLAQHLPSLTLVHLRQWRVTRHQPPLPLLFTAIKGTKIITALHHIHPRPQILLFAPQTSPRWAPKATATILRRWPTPPPPSLGVDQNGSPNPSSPSSKYCNDAPVTEAAPRSSSDELSLSPYILAPKTSNIHIFSIITLNQVILVSKFSESHHVCLQDIPVLMIVAFVWFYAWALGKLILKSMYEDFKIKYMRISRPNIWRLRSFLLKATRQVSLNILHLYTFLSVL
jgi:hypothetical protein